MKSRLRQLIFLTACSVIITVLYGCSSTNIAVNKNQKFHIYECKDDRLIFNLSDSTKVLVNNAPYWDQTILNLFGNGALTFKILKDVVHQKIYDWYEFDTVQPEASRTSSDICDFDINDKKAVLLEWCSSKVDADGSTLYRLEYLLGQTSGDNIVELKQIKEGRFAIRYSGMIP